MKKLTDWLRHFRWQKLLIVWLVFLLIATALFAERSGVQYTGTRFKLNYLDRTTAIPKENALFGQPVTNLLLCDTRQAGVSAALTEFDQLFEDMKVRTQTIDLADTDSADLPDFSDYQTVVVLMMDYTPLGNALVDLMDWLDTGGNALFAMTPIESSYFDVIAPKLGIASTSGSYKMAESIVPAADFMIGGGQRYDFTDPFESSLSVALRDDATVLAVTGDEGVPLIWLATPGKGRVVVDNFGIYAKVVRGFYAASYSFLQDAYAYPVINSAVFYLDDFPSPVPSGDGAYVRRDYGLSIGDFYSQIWWPDITQLAEQYGIRYTGVMIENYEDDTTSAPTRQSDSQQFQYYGGLLLRQGGEIGYHGYNHQPLCLSDTDYGDEYDYNTWPTADAITAAMQELISFQHSVLPYADGTVYVPPSNILSSSGRQILGRSVPQIRTIASTYFSDGTDLPYVQEFGVAADGIVEQPRIVSGSMVGDSYMRLAAVSELNMHYVSTHFMHPDDLLDSDRGAADGWEVYKSGLVDYLNWLTNAAPNLRMQTGTECSAAVQRFSGATVTVDTASDLWTLTVGNLTDEAWFFFRANGGVPGRVTGGELTQLTDSLYLLKATAPTVEIERTEG